MYSQFDICRMATAACVLHELWVGRCRATYDDKPMRARQICIRIIRKVQLISLVNLPKRPSTNLQHHQLELMGVSRKHTRFKKGGWFRWEAPGTGYYKLNIDGSARDNINTGGGVIRDSAGRMIAGFSSMYGTGTNTHAEFLALQEGLDLCRNLQIDSLYIESDSAVVVQAIHKGKVDNWRLFYLVNRCLDSFANRYHIDHMYRQKNTVADR